jgi:hypothetical protein
MDIVEDVQAAAQSLHDHELWMLGRNCLRTGERSTFSIRD